MNHLKNYQIVEPLNKNQHLKLILNEKNKEWRSGLFSKILEEEATITFDDENFKVVSKSKGDPLHEKEWQNKINLIIRNYCADFSIETIKYEKEYEEITHVIYKIEETRKIYLMDYFIEKESKTLLIISHKENIEKFFKQNEELFLKKNFDTSPSIFIKPSILSKPPNEETIIKNNQIDDNKFDKRKLILKNVPKGKKEQDIKRYAFILTKINATSSILSDEKSRTWIVNFDSDIG